MKTKSAFEPHLDLRPEAFTAVLADNGATTATRHAAPHSGGEKFLIEIPEVGGSTFTDTNPWARGGLNE
ncbi:MAG: hypothetical protein QM813_18510 [Verrucomicrobiota bacterium]